jgi:hypothetical protein
MMIHRQAVMIVIATMMNLLAQLNLVTMVLMVPMVTTAVTMVTRKVHAMTTAVTHDKMQRQVKRMKRKMIMSRQIHSWNKLETVLMECYLHLD